MAKKTATNKVVAPKHEPEVARAIEKKSAKAPAKADGKAKGAAPKAAPFVSRWQDGMKISVTAKGKSGNPRRVPESQSKADWGKSPWGRLEAIYAAKTVAEAVKLGAWKATISRAVKDGLVEVK
jgi:hypothetical protein